MDLSYRKEDESHPYGFRPLQQNASGFNPTFSREGSVHTAGDGCRLRFLALGEAYRLIFLGFSFPLYVFHRNQVLDLISDKASAAGDKSVHPYITSLVVCIPGEYTNSSTYSYL